MGHGEFPRPASVLVGTTAWGHVMEVLQLSIRTGDGTATITVAGELDVATEPELKSCAEDILLGRHKRIIIDMSGVSFIGATGLGTLVAIQRSAERQNSAMVLAGVSARLLQLLEITELDRHFTMI